MKTKQLNRRQRRLLADLETGRRPVDVVFEEHAIPSVMFGRWLDSKAFTRAVDDMHRRSAFRLEQQLVSGAERAAMRLHAAVDSGWHPTSAQVQAMINTIKLCQLVVRNPRLKREAAATRERIESKRIKEGVVITSRGYHRSHTPEQAEALPRLIEKRRRREERLDRDQDENGKWMPAD